MGITQRSKMKISTLFSAFAAVYGQVSMETYDDCKIRRWQNFKELCPQTYQCRSINLPNPLVNGEAYQNRETCTTYSCSCSGTERKRGTNKTREGCELMISVNKARCTWDRRRCRNVSNDRLVNQIFGTVLTCKETVQSLFLV